ncbi:glycosyl hydrolase family 28-related protein [Rhodoferax sp. GW822-FHT02A01]|uniref:glycosyl hydrolase family 28-related protein n=1 Tax=Rhodoferax sp. GW822-FHT02A01 TaxID=3141537 RepID=UPI00315DD261
MTTPHRDRKADLLRICSLAAYIAGSAHAADPLSTESSAAPVVFNASRSARPGDIVGLQGKNFGKAPVVTLTRPGESPLDLPLVNQFGTGWLSFRIPESATGALAVHVDNGQTASAPILLNAARAFHLDAMQIVPKGAFKVFGRNLLLPGFTPLVTVGGLPATVDTASSDEHMLQLTAPDGLRATRRVVITVDNGNGTGPSALDRDIDVATSGRGDPFALGVGWGAAFSDIATRVVRADTDTRLGNKPLCNGATDDTAAIQAGIDKLAAAGGGVLQLPAGNCRLAGSVALKSRVVLQGAGKDATLIQYEASYPLMARSQDLVGVRNLTLKNVRAGIESPLLQNNTRIFLQNVRFLLGGGIHMYLSGNTNFVVTDSDFVQPKNAGGYGPYTLGSSGGMVFARNTTTFADGGTNFSSIHDAYVADNRFTRDARGNQNSKVITHSLAMDFAHRVAIVGNTFDVLGGPIVNKSRNDGETLLTEGGGGRRTENLGTVARATPTTLSDPANKQNIALFEGGVIPENYGVAIVGGKGAGQSRRVMAYQADTITVDRVWDVVPDSSSRYVTFIWGLEKSLIKGNTLSQNPRGIWLYQTAVRDIDIVSNVFVEGGGIYLRSAQNIKDRLFTPLYGVRIAGNTVTNTTGEWRSYISVLFVRMDEQDFGVGTIGVEVRDNMMRANTPNLTMPQEESGGAEGYVNRMHAEGPGQVQSLNQTRLLGTIFQNNTCVGCNIGVIVRDGAKGTVQDGNTTGPAQAPK